MKKSVLSALAIAALAVPAPAVFAATPAFASGSCGIYYYDAGHGAETVNCSGFPNGTKVQVIVTCHPAGSPYTIYGPLVSPQYHSAADCGSGAYASATYGT